MMRLLLGATGTRFKHGMKNINTLEQTRWHFLQKTNTTNPTAA